MATSITLKSRTYEGRYMQLTCTSEPDPSNNRHKVTWKLSSIGGTANGFTIAPTVIKINGTQVYSIAKTSYDSGKFPAIKGSVSGTVYVKCNADGTKSCPVYMSTNVYSWTPIEYQDTWVMDTITPQAPAVQYAKVLTAQDFTQSENPTMTYHNPLGQDCDLLEVCISLEGTKGDIRYREVEKDSTSYTFRLTDEEREVLLNATPGTERIVKFYIRTVVGDKKYTHHLDRTFTVTSDANTRADVDVNITVINDGLNEKFDNVIIQGITKLGIEIVPTFKYGATFQSVYSSFNKHLYETLSFVTDPISMLSVFNITGNVYDSRGFRSSFIKTVGYGNAYKTPTFYPYDDNDDTVKLYRSSEDGTPLGSSNRLWLRCTCSGSYIFADATMSENLNNIRLSYRYRNGTSDYWSGWNDLELSAGEVFNGLLDAEFPVKLSHVVELRLIDDVGFASYISFDVPTDDVTFHLGRGLRAAFGKWCERDGLDIAMKTYFGDEVFIDEIKLQDFVIDEGTEGMWNYRAWYGGTLECWGKKSATGQINTAWGSLYAGCTAEFEEYPIPFIEEPVVTYGLETDRYNGWLATHFDATVEKTVKPHPIEIVRPTAQTAESIITYSVHAIGRWM